MPSNIHSYSLKISLFLRVFALGAIIFELEVIVFAWFSHSTLGVIVKSTNVAKSVGTGRQKWWACECFMPFLIYTRPASKFWKVSLIYPLYSAQYEYSISHTKDRMAKLGWCDIVRLKDWKSKSAWIKIHIYICILVISSSCIKIFKNFKQKWLIQHSVYCLLYCIL